MDAWLLILRIYIVFVAASGFIFGEMFFDTFEWSATITGVFGLISGFLGGKFARKAVLRAKIIITCCFLSLCGVALDAYDYYANLDIPGNYYAWTMIGPYCIALMLIIWSIIHNMPSNNAFKRDAEKSPRPLT